MLSLKRFRYETFDGGTKVNDQFNFDVQLDMAPYRVGNSTDADDTAQHDVFELVGVIVHQGTLQYGHYWSYVKDCRTYGEQPGHWYRMEDAKVTSHGLETVLQECRGGLIQQPNGELVERSDNAYILFYHRVESGDRRSEDRTLTTVAQRDPVLPAEMAVSLAKSNNRVARLIHLFDNAHATFMGRLFERQGYTSTESDASSTKGDKKLLSTAFKYLDSFILERMDMTCLEHYVRALARVATSSPENAISTLHLLFRADSRKRFFLEKLATRQALGQLTLACLDILRKHAPACYSSGDGDSPQMGASNLSEDGYCYKVLREYAQLMPDLYQHRHAWNTYLPLVVQIAAWGPQETALVLDFGYLSWCLRTLYVAYDPHFRRDITDSSDLLQNSRRTPWALLVDTVHGLFSYHVDLSDLAPSTAVSEHESHVVVDGLCRLNRLEMTLLRHAEPRSPYGPLIVEASCLSVEGLKSSEEYVSRTDLIHDFVLTHFRYPFDWKPQSFIACLLADNVDRRFQNAVLKTFLGHLEEACDDHVNFVVAAIHVMHQRNVVIEVKSTIMDFMVDLGCTGKFSRELLFFLNGINDAMPYHVLKATPTWTPEFLITTEHGVPEGTVNLLKKLLFTKHIITMPSTQETLNLDMLRLKVARDMFEEMNRHRRKIMRTRSLHAYPSLVKMLHGSHSYLARFHAVVMNGGPNSPAPSTGTEDTPRVKEDEDGSLEPPNPLVIHGGNVAVPPAMYDSAEALVELLRTGEDDLRYIEKQLEESDAEAGADGRSDVEYEDDEWEEDEDEDDDMSEGS